MRLIKEYWCDFEPQDDEICQSLEMVNSEDCVIKLNWIVPYWGECQIIIEDGMTFEDCKREIRRIFY